MLARSPSSMSPFLHERIVLRPTNTPLPIVMPRVAVALGVEQAVVVDDDVVADADLARVAQHDVLAEDDVAAAGAEQARVQRLAQHEPERPGHGLAHQRDQFVLDEGPPARVGRRRARAYLSSAELRASNSCSCAFGMSAITATPVRGTTPASAGCRRRGPPAGANPSSARAREMSNARLFVKKSTRRRYSGGSMPSGAHTASHAAPASHTGQTGRCSDGGWHAGGRRDPAHELVERRHLAPGQDVGPPRRRRHLAAEPEPLDQVVDVGQMVEDLARPERDEPAPRDAPEQLQQPAVAGAVDAARPGDHQFDPGPRRRLAAEALPLELRPLVLVARPQRRVFVGRRVLDVAVHADRAAMHDARGHPPRPPASTRSRDGRRVDREIRRPGSPPPAGSWPRCCRRCRRRRAARSSDAAVGQVAAPKFDAERRQAPPPARLRARTSARTSSPRRSSARARWPPVKPVAPVTSARIAPPPR